MGFASLDVGLGSRPGQPRRISALTSQRACRLSQATASIIRNDRGIELCQPKIQDFDSVTASPVRFKPKVVRFQVPVNDAVAMRLVERRAGLFDDVYSP